MSRFVPAASEGAGSAIIVPVGAGQADVQLDVDAESELDDEHYKGREARAAQAADPAESGL
jgi:hypothetical protein